MKADPKFSIVVPNYNKGKYVRECLESVLSQSFDEWELLFIDDNSDDESADHAFRISQVDSRVRFFKNQTGLKGANSCRNIGIKESLASFIIFLDSDDLMSSDCLIERWKDINIRKDGSILVYQTGLFYNELYDSKIVCNIKNDLHHLDRFLARDLVWLISGPVWPKKALNDLGGFNLELQSHQEYDLHVRALIEGYEFEFLNRKPNVFYRQNVKSESRSNSQTLEHLEARVKMTLHHLELLKKNELLTENRKTLIARYLLDISQMMRWHKAQLGNKALEYALDVWAIVRRESVIDRRTFYLGNLYLRFKHQLIFNHFKFLQNKIELGFHNVLSEYIHRPSKTFCKTEFSN